MKIQSLQKWVKKNWPHIIIWLLVILNFFLSPVVYSKYMTSQGKPITVSDDVLPSVTDKGKIYIDGLDPILLDGENLYRLWGWAFLTIDKDIVLSDYTRYIILESDNKIYKYPVTIVERTGVQEAFKDLNMDLLNSGFYANISEESISLGVYRIYVEFEKADGVSYLLSSANMIEKTPNSISLR